MLGSRRARADVPQRPRCPGANSQLSAREVAAAQTSHSVYIREDGILDAVTSFFAERIFGEDRRLTLAAELGKADDGAERQRRADEDRLKRTLANIERRQAAVLRQAMDGDPDDPFTKGLRATYNELDAEKSATQAALAANSKTTDTDRPAPENLELLDALPYLAAHLLEAPEDLLRPLFEVTRLQVRLHGAGGRATISIHLPAARLDDVTDAASGLARTGDERADYVRAPDGVRTRTGSILSRLPLPVGLRGHRTA